MTHRFRLSQTPPQINEEGGSKTLVTPKNFPLIKGMSFAKLVIKPLGIREPHWHADADELGYCLSGKVLVSLYGNGNLKAKFLVQAGEAYFIPSGALHTIENAGNVVSEIIVQFSAEDSKDFALSSTLGMFTNSVLGNTWHVAEEVFEDYKRSLDPLFITLAKKMPDILDEYKYSSPFKYGLAKSPKIVANEGGSAQVARNNVWPILKRQAVYNLILTGQGMREPHWHPETAELGYVAEGKARMTILSPEGALETYDLEAGDIYFIPGAYPHHIENLTSGKMHFLIFFDQGLPGDIGLSGSVKSFTNYLLESTLRAPEGLFDKLPTYFENQFIVEIINPLD